jgi:hypothetical protein
MLEGAQPGIDAHDGRIGALLFEPGSQPGGGGALPAADLDDEARPQRAEQLEEQRVLRASLEVQGVAPVREVGIGIGGMQYPD